MQILSKFLVILICIFVCLVPLDADGKNTAKTANAPRIKDRWAVIIGVDKFQDKSVVPLNNASHNAINLNDYLIARGGYEEDHIKLLVNEKASHRKIFDTLSTDWLLRVAKKNDLVVIYISTTCSEKKFDVKQHRYLYAHDTKTDNLFATGIDLDSFISKLVNQLKSDNLVVIIDSDYSGAAKITPVSHSASITETFNLSRPGGVILICSCSEDEKTILSKDEEGTVFTKLLIDFIADGDFDCPISETFELTKNKVMKQVNTDGKVIQSPIMKSNWNGDMPSIQPPVTENN